MVETKEDFEKASTLLAISNYFNVPATAIVMIEDNLINENRFLRKMN